jgi:hypothetical protein
MWNLCKYKDIFGKPNEGVHSYRVAGIAIVDFTLTVFAAIIISRVFQIQFWITLVVLLLTGIIMHRMFCVRTAIDRMLP